jgi:hypothetical protein
MVKILDPITLLHFYNKEGKDAYFHNIKKKQEKPFEKDAKIKIDFVFLL